MIDPKEEYKVWGWMITDLNLRASQLSAYALLYEESNGGKLKVNETVSHISEMIGRSNKSASMALCQLEARGLIRTAKSETGVEVEVLSCGSYPG